MGIMESAKNWIQPQRETHTLYVSIVEIPQPRDWGSIQLAVSNDMVHPSSTPNPVLYRCTSIKSSTCS